MRSTSSLAILLLAGAAFAQQTAWGQCGGNGWTGATTCVSGYTCTYSNPWYSQCLPGNATTSATPTIPTSTSKPASSTTKPNTTLTTTTTKPTSTTTTSTPTTSKPASTTVSAGYPGTTLQTGYYWIRAVEDPNFHKYLQTSTTTPGLAILDSYTTAGQFQIVSGQLVQLTASGLLYANVETQANSTVTKLGMTFKTTQNTYGTFQWSGDALQWSVPTITRPNLSAWLVCANQQLFINLGAYLYMTPAGCADETIHFYNGATAVS